MQWEDDEKKRPGYPAVAEGDLARTLATLPRYRTQHPREALTVIGYRLGLTRFALNPSDALAAYLTRTSH